MNTTNTTAYLPSVADYTLIGIQGTVSVFAFLLMFLLILLRNKNPLKSRGIIPFVGMGLFLSLIVRTMIQVFGYFNVNVDGAVTKNFACYWFILSQAPVMIVFLLLALVNMIRYIATEQLANLKTKAWKIHARRSLENVLRSEEDEKVYKTIETKVRIGKFMLSLWVVIPIVVLAVIFWIVIEVLVVAIGSAVVGEQCLMASVKGFNILNTMQGINIAIFLLVALVTLVFFVVDMILFVKAHGFSPLQYFKYDALFFRLEYMLNFIWLFLATGMSSYSFYNRNPPTVLVSVFLGTIEIVGLFTTSGFIICVTVIKMCLTSRKKLDPKSLRDVIKDQEGREKLFEFTRREWSSENLMAFVEIQEIKNLRHSATTLQMEKAKEIFDTYFKTGACIEVNLPNDVKRDLQRIVSQDKIEGDISAFFDGAEKELLSNLNDTFLRWSITRDYREWAAKHLNGGVIAA